MSLTKEETKEAFKEAVKEWLDEQYRNIGHWTVKMIIVLALGALTYFILKMEGWHK